MFDILKKTQKAVDSGQIKTQGHDGAVIPAAAQGVLCGEDRSAGVSGIPASTLIVTTSDGFSSFAQNNR